MVGLRSMEEAFSVQHVNRWAVVADVSSRFKRLVRTTGCPAVKISIHPKERLLSLLFPALFDALVNVLDVLDESHAALLSWERVKETAPDLSPARQRWNDCGGQTLPAAADGRAALGAEVVAHVAIPITRILQFLYRMTTIITSCPDNFLFGYRL